MLRSKKIEGKIDIIIDKLEKSNLQDLSYVVGNKWSILGRNFLAGISRGVGIGIGVTVISAILILVLRHIVALNLPVIGEYIKDIVEIVENTKH